MNAKEFLKNFGHLADAPDGISKLRQTILQLAVQGKLVEQDPNDEPAGNILNQEHSLPAGVERKAKLFKSSPLSSKLLSLQKIPNSWQYASIRELYEKNIVIDYGDGNHGSLYPRKSEFGNEGVTYVTARDINSGRVQWSGCSKLKNSKARELVKGWATGGDILLTHNATVGRVAKVESDIENFLLGTSVTFYRLNTDLFSSCFLYHVFCSPVWQSQLSAVMQQTTRNQVSIQKQAFFLIPFPPLAEQKRIVAKVDELMALCDDLEAKQQERRAVHVRVNTAALDSLSTAGTDTEFDDAWSRVRSNFDLLYSVPENINTLRQTILRIAVKGKLVEQCVSDSNKMQADTTVGDFITFQNGYAFKSQWFKNKGIRLVRNANVGHGELIWGEENTKFVNKDIAEEYHRFSLKQGRLIVLSLDRPLIKTGLKIATITEDDLPSLLLQRVARAVFKGLDELDPTYFLLWLMSPEFTDSIDPGRSLGVPHISTRDIQQMSFAPPTINTQKRIVAKVDELMALCDDLEAKLTQQQGDADRLTEAMVAAVLDSAAA